MTINNSNNIGMQKISGMQRQLLWQRWQQKLRWCACGWRRY